MINTTLPRLLLPSFRDDDDDDEGGGGDLPPITSPLQRRRRRIQSVDTHSPLRSSKAEAAAAAATPHYPPSIRPLAASSSASDSEDCEEEARDDDNEEGGREEEQEEEKEEEEEEVDGGKIFDDGRDAELRRRRWRDDHEGGRSRGRIDPKTRRVSSLSSSARSNYGCTGLETLLLAPAGTEIQKMEPEHKLSPSPSWSPHLELQDDDTKSDDDDDTPSDNDDDDETPKTRNTKTTTPSTPESGESPLPLYLVLTCSRLPRNIQKTGREEQYKREVGMCFKEYTNYDTAADGSLPYQSLCRGSSGNSNKQKIGVVSGFVDTCGGWEKEEVEVIPMFSPSNEDGSDGKEQDQEQDQERNRPQRRGRVSAISISVQHAEATAPSPYVRADLVTVERRVFENGVEVDIGPPGREGNVDHRDVKIFSREEKEMVMQPFLPPIGQNVMDKVQGQIDPSGSNEGDKKISKGVSKTVHARGLKRGTAQRNYFGQDASKLLHMGVNYRNGSKLKLLKKSSNPVVHVVEKKKVHFPSGGSRNGNVDKSKDLTSTKIRGWLSLCEPFIC